MCAQILAENIVDGKFNIDVYQKTRVCLPIKNLHVYYGSRFYNGHGMIYSKSN